MVITGRGMELMTPVEHVLTNELALTQLHTATLQQRAAAVRSELMALQEMIATATVHHGGRAAADDGEWSAS